MLWIENAEEFVNLSQKSASRQQNLTIPAYTTYLSVSGVQV